MCKRFAKEFGVLHISVGGGIRKILENQPHTNLAEQIQEYLFQGEVIPDELAVEALAVVLLDTACTTRGYGELSVAIKLYIYQSYSGFKILSFFLQRAGF